MAEKKPIKEVFGENLRRIIKEKTNLDDFAKTNNINRRKLARWISGESFPESPEIEKLSDLLEVPEAEFFIRNN